MSWWIYKCNSKQRDYQHAWGDWREYYKDPDRQWGSTDWVPTLAKLQQGDMIIAYQTDRNELVGIARVRQSCERDSFLYLEPGETIGVKVRPLKKADPMIAAIPALQPGPIKTIYEISDSDADRLLIAAKQRRRRNGGNRALHKALPRRRLGRRTIGRTGKLWV